MLRKSLFAVLFFFIIIMSIAPISCGEDDDSDEDNGGSDDDDDDDDDGANGNNQDGESLFSTTEIAPITGDIDYRLVQKWKIPRENGVDVYIALQKNDGSDTRLEKYIFSGMTSEGEILDSRSLVTTLSDYGLGGMKILDLEYTCNELFMLVQDTSSDSFNVYFVPLTGRTEDMHLIGQYTNAYFWVRECGNYRQAQVLAYSRGVSFSTGEHEIWKGDLWDWDPNRETPWQVSENALDNLPNGENFFLEANISVFSGHHYNYKWGSSFIAIDYDGKLHWYDSKQTGDDPTSIKFEANEQIFANFNGRGLKAQYLDIENEENLHMYDNINSPQNAVHPKYICVVGTDGQSDTPLLWVTNGGDFKFREDETFEIGYAGACSVTANTEAISPTATIYHPWVAYRSAKNELSALWLSQTQGEWVYSLIDSIPQDNWHFASGHLLMGSGGSGVGGRIMVIYDDNDSLKLAACKDRGPCGDY